MVMLPHLTKPVLLSVVAVVALLVAIGVTYSRVTSTAYCKAVKLPFAHTVCEMRPNRGDRLALVWQKPTQGTQPPSLVLNFATLQSLFPKSLKFAMNAGMYDSRYAPIGYTVIDGKQIRSLNLKQGGGNFHLMPNGVFWADANGYHITESQAMAKALAAGAKPLLATQSGPMLVIDGKIHPSFDPISTSMKLRNGVGVCQDGNVKFIISDTWVSFYQFAELFKSLKCDNALFLDGGSASALYSPELKRQDNKSMGVILAVINDK